jgi:hypothetical protein
MKPGSYSYDSDQSEIWGEISTNLLDDDMVSPTWSHRDYYQRKLPDITDYLDAFDLEEYPVDVLVFINGKIKVIDTVSSPVAYKNLHGKLLKSYALEAVLDKNNSTNSDLSQESEKFIENIKDAPESKLKSLGHGGGHRFEGESVLGSALICWGEVIHASFFKNELGRNEGVRWLVIG